MSSRACLRRSPARLALAAAAFVACSEPRRIPPRPQTQPDPIADAAPPAPMPSDALVTPPPPLDAAPAPAPDAPLPPPPACGPTDGVCPSGCAPKLDADCALKAGAACTSNDQCGPSVICADGFCCKESCRACQSCTGPGGTCVDLPLNARDSTLPTRCFDHEICDGKGACKRERGTLCNRAEECLSGFCADDVCCDRSCNAPCEKCNSDLSGTCTPVGGLKHDEPACSGETQFCFPAGVCATRDQDGGLGKQGYLPTLNRSEAQIFTVGITGRMTGIDLGIDCKPGQSFTLTIDNVGAAGPANRPVVPAQQHGHIASQDDKYLYPFPAPVPVTAGQRLMIVIRPVSGECTFTWGSDGGYPTSRGHHMWEEQGRWVRSDGLNLVFRTYVAP